MFTREDLNKVYKYMARHERGGLAEAWGVTLANCTRYCLAKGRTGSLSKVRWAKMLTIWPANVWMARLSEAKAFDKTMAEEYMTIDPNVIRIDIVIPGGKNCIITVNGRER